MSRTATATKPARSNRKQSAKKVEQPSETRNQQGHRIQALIDAGLYTVAQLSERTKLSIARVMAHVNYEISKGRAKFNGKKQVLRIVK